MHRVKYAVGLSAILVVNFVAGCGRGEVTPRAMLDQATPETVAALGESPMATAATEAPPGATPTVAPTAAAHGEYASHIAVDSRGFVWVVEGLPWEVVSMYDGTQWSEVTPPESDISHIGVSGIRAIVADGVGHVYALTDNDCGLYEHDGATWNVLIEDCHGPLMIGPMSAITADPNGRLWLAGSTGVIPTFITSITAFDGRGWLEPYVLPTNEMVFALALGAHGILWAGTYDGELLALDTSNTAANPLAASLMASNDGIAELAVDGADRVWVGGETGALYLVEDGNVTELWAPTGNNGNVVDIIEIDTAGRTWVVGPNCAQLEDCRGPGITVFDGESSRRFTRENSTLPNNVVNGLAFDGSGRVWLATRGGVFVMPVTDLLSSPPESSPGG